MSAPAGAEAGYELGPGRVRELLEKDKASNGRGNHNLAFVMAGHAIAEWGLKQDARADAAEKIVDDAIALWVSIGHPMLLAAAQELREARAALAAAPAQQQNGEG